PGRTVTLNSGQERLAKGIEAACREAAFQPPTGDELRPRFQGRDFAAIVAYLLEQGRLIRLGNDLLLHRDWLGGAKRRSAAHFAQEQTLSVAQFRDLLATSRKYALPLLEYFDEQRLTR